MQRKAGTMKQNRREWVGVSLVLATVWLAGVAGRVHGADSTWTNAAGGVFSDGGNWNNGVPGSGNRATFNLNQDYTVTWTGGATNNEAYFSQPNGRKVTLNLGNQAWRLGNELRVGHDSGQNAVVEQDGGRVLITNALFVSGGNPGGVGRYTVRNGGTLRFNGGTLGYVAGGSVLEVDGLGSLCTNAVNTLFVGYFGATRMVVTNQGAFKMGSGVLYLGYTAKNCALTVAGGGRFEAPNLTVSQLAAATGNQVRVTGNNSLLKAPVIAVGGNGGHNRMTVGQGGTVECTDFFLGYSAAANTLTVEGGGTVRASALRSSFTTGGISNTIRVTGGRLIVTNAAGTAYVWLGPNQGLTGRLALEGGSAVANEMTVFSGTLQMTGGTGTFSQLKAELNPGSILQLYGGVLNTKSTRVANGSAVTIGNGTLTAVLNLQGGGHRFADGLVIADNATLTGVGSITGDITVSNGGAIAPGSSAGTLVCSNNLALSSQSQLRFDLGPFDFATGRGYVGGGTNDLIEVKGHLTLDGVLNISGLPGLDSFGATKTKSYRLFNYTGNLVNNGLVIGAAPRGAAAYVIDTSTDKQVNLTVLPPSGTVVMVF